MKCLSDKLRTVVGPTTVVVGVGNRLRRDDAAGVALVDRVAGRTRFPCIDAGVAPENFLEEIASYSPDTVLFVDAAHFGGQAGEVRVAGIDELGDGGVSTHGLSLSMVGEYLRARTRARIFVVAVQPEMTTIGEDMSPAVAAGVGRIAEALMELGGADA